VGWVGVGVSLLSLATDDHNYYFGVAAGVAAAFAFFLFLGTHSPT